MRWAGLPASSSRRTDGRSGLEPAVAAPGRPRLFSRIGVMRALNRHVERVFDPSRKEKHWGRRKLARDR